MDILLIEFAIDLIRAGVSEVKVERSQVMPSDTSCRVCRVRATGLLSPSLVLPQAKELNSNLKTLSSAPSAKLARLLQPSMRGGGSCQLALMGPRD